MSITHMWSLSVDESDDFGFDFFTKSPSKYFTVCVLLVRQVEHNQTILSAVAAATHLIGLHLAKGKESQKEETGLQGPPVVY